MLIEIGPEVVTGGAAPDHPAVARHGGGLRIAGHRTGGEELYVARHPTSLLLSSRIETLLDALRERNRPIGVSDRAVSFLLHHSFVPLPATEYEGIAFLGMGDTLDLAVDGGTITGTPRHAYPWLNDSSPEDSTPDPDALLGLLTQSIERALDGMGRDGFLMLSSGKDSVSVALALAEAGYGDVPCVTYRSSESDGEAETARAVCSRLGLRHVVIDHPVPGRATEEALVTFFTDAPRPCGDPVLIPYVLCVAQMNPRGGFVLDGGGNDSYMGFLPSKRDRAKLRFRVRGAALRRLGVRLTPFDSPLNYVLRSRIESTFSLRTLRYRESSTFFPGSVDTHAYWNAESRRTRGLAHADLKSIRARHADPAKSMLKFRLAARHIGASPVMPFCDLTLADYYFGLPREARFDPSGPVNKLLLREMLLAKLDYDASAIGKHVFPFDGARFLAENRDFVLGEIATCALWNSTVGPAAAAWLDQLGRRPFLYHALLVMFQVSAWHNHSRFVPRDVASTHP